MTLSPGQILYVANPVDMPSHSTITIQLSNATSATGIVVSGGVTISGSLTLTLPSAPSGTETSNEIITAASVSGQFRSVSVTGMRCKTSVEQRSAATSFAVVVRFRNTCARLSAAMMGSLVAIGVLVALYMLYRRHWRVDVNAAVYDANEDRQPYTQFRG